MGLGIGGHHRAYDGKTNDWGTPLWLVQALGEFDLDPCGRAGHPTARTIWEGADGLEKEWRGRVWMNPPYGPHVGRWLDRLAEHGNGIALVFARTETRTFFESIWGKADALLFLRGRLHFLHPNGSVAVNNSGGPSVLAAYGTNNAEALAKSNLAGALVTAWAAENENITWLNL